MNDEDGKVARRVRPPAGAADRLAALRKLFVAEPVGEAVERLARERPVSREPFAQAVAGRLRELRALMELTRHVQRRGIFKRE